jgi:hypothetical protein
MHIRTHALLTLLCLAAIAATASGCKKNNLKANSASEAAKIWGTLLCDRRGDTMNIHVELLKKQQENAVMHKQITHGIAKESNPLARIDAILEYVRENRKAINVCTAEAGEPQSGEGGKYMVDVRLTFQQLTWSADNKGHLTERAFTLPVEVSQIDGQWLITSEPPTVPSDDLLGLVSMQAN